MLLNNAYTELTLYCESWIVNHAPLIMNREPLTMNHELRNRGKWQGHLYKRRRHLYKRQRRLTRTGHSRRREGFAPCANEVMRVRFEGGVVWEALTSSSSSHIKYVFFSTLLHSFPLNNWYVYDYCRICRILLHDHYTITTRFVFSWNRLTLHCLIPVVGWHGLGIMAHFTRCSFFCTNTPQKAQFLSKKRRYFRVF